MRQIKDRRQGFAERTPAVPEVARPGIGDAQRLLARGTLAQADSGLHIHWQPDDEGAQIFIRHFFEHVALHFGGPPKTGPSSRIHQE
jgi:hypothetical protein